MFVQFLMNFNLHVSFQVGNINGLVGNVLLVDKGMTQYTKRNSTYVFVVQLLFASRILSG